MFGRSTRVELLEVQLAEALRRLTALEEQRLTDRIQLEDGLERLHSVIARHRQRQMRDQTAQNGAGDLDSKLLERRHGFAR